LPPENPVAARGITGHKAKNANFQRGRVCQQCKNTGYKGRTGLFDVLVNDEMVQDMILKRYSNQAITKAAVEAGTLRTLQDDAAAKVMSGITTLEEASSAVMT
jgi:type IV pilus assembly protein PilB